MAMFHFASGSGALAAVNATVVTVNEWSAILYFMLVAHLPLTHTLSNTRPTLSSTSKLVAFNS